MKIKNVKVQQGNLKLLNDLLKDTEKSVHGVAYTNTFFSKRYLCRSHVLKNNIDLEDDKVELTIVSRLERVGLLEIENTLDSLVRFEAGDIPGFTPEWMLSDINEETTDQFVVPEPLSVNQFLYSVDVDLVIRNPEVTYQELTIAGSKLVLVNLHKQFDDYFDEDVSILFGEGDKFSVFSHFYDKELTGQDAETVLNFIVDENITGKAIRAITLSDEDYNGFIFPYDEPISSYISMSDDYVFGAGAGYIRIPVETLKDYTLHCESNGNGSYELKLTKGKRAISFLME